MNSSNFMKFYNNCVIPQISKYQETVLTKLQDNEVFRMFVSFGKFKEIDLIQRYINLGNNGKISFEEYAVFVSRVEKYDPEEQIKRKNDNGFDNDSDFCHYRYRWRWTDSTW